MATEYVVKSGDKQQIVRVDDHGERAIISVDGREFAFAVTTLPDGRVALSQGDERRSLRTFASREGLTVVDRHVQRSFEVVDAREQWLHGAGGRKGGGGGRITASMPGRVVRIPVAVGDVVESGGVVAVLEAMKMENDVRAPGGGRVAAVAVSEGSTVEAGALLVQLEPLA